MEGKPEPIDPAKLEIKVLSAADRKDLDDLEELELLTFGRAAQNVWGLVPMIVHGRVFLARYEGAPVGWAILIADWHERSAAYVWSFAVVQQHHQRGIGKTLLAEVLRQLATDGYRKLQATVSPANARAMHLLTRSGWERAAVLPAWFGDSEDRWLMAREVSPEG